MTEQRIMTISTWYADQYISDVREIIKVDQHYVVREHGYTWYWDSGTMEPAVWDEPRASLEAGC